MKHSVCSFIRRHPLSLREVIATPMIFREYVEGFEGLPFPRSAIIQDLAAFGGHGPGAVRTALSRLRMAGELVSFIDPSGVVRFRFTKSQKSVSGVVRAWPARPEGFHIGVFSLRALDAFREELAAFLEEPPIPARIQPPGYPLSELWSYLDSLLTASRTDIVYYYRTWCE